MTSTTALPVVNSRPHSQSQLQTAQPSYEIFAPRTVEERSCLSRIQVLTSGPMFTSGNYATNISNNSSQHQQRNDYNSHKSDSFISNAMIPPPPTSSPPSPQSDTINASLFQAKQKKQTLIKVLHQSNRFQRSIKSTLSLTHELTLRHSTLLQHSSELSLAAERLQTQSSQLSQHAHDIGLPLKHYDAVDSLSVDVGVLFKNGRVVRGLANVSVDRGVEYYSLVCRIEDAVRFFRERRDDWSMRNKVELSNSKRSARQRYESESTSGSVEYYKRALVLREVALDLLREAIVQRIVQTTEQIVNALGLGRRVRRSIGGGSGGTASTGVVRGDILEASLIYTRFHGISHRSQSLLGILKKCLERQQKLNLQEEDEEQKNGTLLGKLSVADDGKRMNHHPGEDEECPYVGLWNLCRNSYTQSRETLLKDSVKAHLDFLKEKHGLVGMARLASVFLIRLCTVETSLYLDFFGSGAMEQSKNANGENLKAGAKNSKNDGVEKVISSTSNNRKANAATLASQVMSPTGSYYDPQFQLYLDTLCTTHLHRTIRRGLVSLSDLDTLCQIVSVLREEMSLASASPTTMAASRALAKVIVDAQERLIYCANSVLAKEVLRFTSSPEDLDYPDVLRRFREQQEMELERKQDEAGSNRNLEGNKKEDETSVLKHHQLQIYESWFPPIRSVIKVLSKIFRVVEPKVFEDIALTGVQACARILRDGSLYVEKKSGVLHSDLFLVKHLLILREQLSPFDIQLRSVERQLDFSDAGKAVSKFLANRNRRLFSMSTQNALVTLLCEGVSTRESSIDSKRDLEDSLRSACNDFIEHTVISLIGPVLTFIDQCKGHVTAAKSVIGEETRRGSVPSLRKQSFMTVEYVRAIVNRTFDRLEVELGELTTQMELYMDNSATAGILLKPVIRKISRYLEEAKRFMSEGIVQDDQYDDDEEAGWNKEVETDIFNIMDQIETKVKAAAT